MLPYGESINPCNLFSIRLGKCNRDLMIFFAYFIRFFNDFAFWIEM